MDLLSQLMEHFSIRTGVFYSGRLCGVSHFQSEPESKGHLHILNAGELLVTDASGIQQHITHPCMIYIPQNLYHRLEGDKNTKVVCATVDYRGGQINPLLSALPDVIVIPFASAPQLRPVLDMLSQEADSQVDGQEFLMNRLSDALMALIFRYLIQQKKVDRGVFSALAHPRLASVFTAIHQPPVRHFSINEMASLAAMSRTQFIEVFRQVVGDTPGDYVQKWRISVAQSFLLQNKPISWVSDEVGYSSYSGFSRAFHSVAGTSPRKWLHEKKLG